MSAPPRAPTFPSLDPDPVREVDEEVPVELPSQPAAPTYTQLYDRQAASTADYDYSERRSSSRYDSDPVNNTRAALSHSDNKTADMSGFNPDTRTYNTSVPSRDDPMPIRSSVTTGNSIAGNTSGYQPGTASSSLSGRTSLPPTQTRSRLRAVLTWKDPKVTGPIFAVSLIFFYLTLYKQYSILSVCGAALAGYLIIGLIVVQVNPHVGNPFDRFVRRPPTFTPLLSTASAHRWADTIVEEGNEFADAARDVLYCDNTRLTGTWIIIALIIYFIGKFCSLLPVFFVFILAAFSLPKAYEMNKEQVDGALARASEMAAHHLHTGRKVAGERAWQLKDMAAQRSAPLLEKAPAVKNLANRVGFTPTKKQM